MPNIDLTSTASGAEIAWTTVGLLALIVNVGLTWNAWWDYVALIRLGRNGALRIAARTAVTIQTGLTVPQLIAVGIGIFAMLAPPPVPAVPITRGGLVLTLGLIAIEIVLVGVGIYTQLRRILLLGYLDRQERSEEETRHTETMTELVHNTEVTTEARDGAQHAYEAASSVNLKIAETNRVAGQASEAAMESTDKLRELMEKLEHERQCRAEGRTERDESRLDRAEDREDRRDQALLDAADKLRERGTDLDNRRDERERNRQ